MSLSKLHSAAEAGDLVLVKRLVVEGHDLQERAPYGWPGWGGTPLHFAVRCVPKVNEVIMVSCTLYSLAVIIFN